MLAMKVAWLCVCVMLGGVDANHELKSALRLIEQAEIKPAIEVLERAVCQFPNDARIHYILGESLLRVGEYRRGWAEYEWRMQAAGYKQENADVPLWDGKPLGSDVLLVQSEQGVGDSFQFVRYLGLLRQRGIKFVFRPPGNLRQLFSALPELIPEKAGVNYRVPLASLPHFLGVHDPAEAPRPPYLVPSAKLSQRWRDQLPSGFKVGIAWQGARGNKSDFKRSFKAADLRPLLSSGASLVSLQKNDGSEQLADLPGAIDLGPSLDSKAAFIDTAAVLANVDLVVTCDSAVAHLAGAMNRPVWLALARVPDWRWGMSDQRTPWYPSMRLFRQQVAGDWGEVFTRIADELRKLV